MIDAVAGVPRREFRDRWRCRLTVALAVIWLADAALQAQPIWFTEAFSHQVIGPAAAGQPDVVSVPLHWVEGVVAAAPWMNMVFVAVQLAIGLGLLARRSRRTALLASAAWAAGVWYFGDGLGGVLSGQGSLLTGFPSAPAVYVVISLALWPGNPGDPRQGSILGVGGQAARVVDRWLAVYAMRIAVLGWFSLWAVGAVFGVLPAQLHQLPAAFTADAGSPDPAVADAGGALAAGVMAHPVLVAVVVSGIEAVLAIAVLHPRTRSAGAAGGIVLAGWFWVVGQQFGGIPVGAATDVAAGPVYALLGMALIMQRRPADAAASGVGEGEPVGGRRTNNQT